MSEVSKVIISFSLLIILCFGCFFAGYLLSNRRATERINEANQQLREEQQRYDELVKSSEERIAELTEQLSGKIGDSRQATQKLRELIEQIKRQRIDL